MPIVDRRSFLLGGAAALGTLAVAGCGMAEPLPNSLETVTPGVAGGPSRGGVLYFGLSTDPANFDPHVTTGSASDYLRQLTYNGLLQFDGKGEIIGDLATSFGWSSPTVYAVELRPGVKFHDGSTLTPDDVVYSFQRMLDPATAASSAAMLSNLDSVVATGPNALEIRLKVPDVTIPLVLCLPTTNIVSQKWMTSGGDFKTKTMGTGPFTLVERVPGVSISFEAFNDYFEPDLPYLNGIVFQPMGDDYARVTALRTATVDMIDYVPATHVDVVTSNPRLVFASDKSFGFGFVGFDTAQKPFDDVRVRQAVAMSIDRQSVLDTAFLGHGAAMDGGLMPPAFATYADQLSGLMPYDPEQAQFLLKQAGQEGLVIPIVTTSSYSVISRPAQALLPGLRAGGMEPQLTQQEWLTFRASVADKSFPVHAWGTAPKYGDPASLRDFIGSTGTFAKNLSFGDPTIDGLLEQGYKESNEQVRAELYLDAEKRALELVPMTYTVRREQGEAHYDYVRGYEHPPKGAWTATALRRTWIEERA